MRFLVLAALAAAWPARASGPYATDDSFVTPAGERQVETWGSLTARGHRVFFVPAFTPRAVPFLELSAALETERLSGARSSAAGVQAKARLLPEPAQAGAVGLSVAGGARVPTGGAESEAFANGALSWAATGSTLVHLNLGWSGFIARPEGGVTWGARLEQTLRPERLVLHAELFGAGAGRPGMQLGLRPTLASGTIDLELVAGRNLGGERATWMTLGAAFRF